jgi:short subunit dehydrogenase-like uncharacterized protein
MPAPDVDSDREFDLIVWGATGFTGRLVVEYLAPRYPVGDTLNWAVAGRSRDKLEKMLGGLEQGARRPEFIVADSHDAESMAVLASRSRVILSTVGPYARYGTELVAACVANGTDYCDLCGEVQWMRRIIDDYQRAAEQSGARIVMSCGFDSIPSDLGVWRLNSLAREQTGSPCTDVRLLVRAVRGGASGGTYASMLNAVEEARRDKKTARILADPYALNPDGERHGPDGGDQASARFDEETGLWTGPFVMASVNTRVVRRSNALLGYPYGREFRYREATITGKGLRGRLKAVLMSLGLKLFVLAAAIPLTRNSIVRKLIPAPGEGPSRQQRENGFFKLLLIGRTCDGTTMRLRVTGDRDPGYGSTSKMLAEAAVSLATNESPAAGGCWTPASALGDALYRRLTARAGLTFELE